ncbi:hypothetical protein GGE06_007620 [Streptomyces sp. SFB5A]|uniref:Uncharacterized protein n=1 Tax=Streptomyces nymphaeiformis TaxID=2663842 RepID=A0A7W7U9E4_9ACTN|nr:hypothetical protein [Streptomyces nymphaeiformis]
MVIGSRLTDPCGIDPLGRFYGESSMPWMSITRFSNPPGPTLRRRSL